MRLSSRTLPTAATVIAALLCGRFALAVLPTEEDPVAQVQYLEIVTPDLDATCETLEALHGVSFSPPMPGLGGARTATLAGGGRIGVRAPMRADEEPVVRPYLLVEDIDIAVEVAREAGAEIAHPPLEIPGEGMFAIYILGGNQYGLWQD